jgi:uncharacterized protein YfkK (UPF0435 family)
LNSFKIFIGTTIDEQIKRINETMFPLRFSFDPNERAESKYDEERAFRVIRSMPRARLAEELQRADQRNDTTDFKSSLFLWACRTYSDDNKLPMLELKAEYEKGLGLDVLEMDKRSMELMFSEIEQKLLLVNAGAFSFEDAKDFSEWTSLMKVAQLSLNDETFV